MSSISPSPPAEQYSKLVELLPAGSRLAASTASATCQPMPSSPKIGFPRPITRVLPRSAVMRSTILAQHLDGFTTRIADLHFQRHLARQRVSGAAKARIIGAEGHFDPIEQPFRHHRSLLDESLRSLLDRHTDRGVVVGGADN